MHSATPKSNTSGGVVGGLDQHSSLQPGDAHSICGVGIRGEEKLRLALAENTPKTNPLPQAAARASEADLIRLMKVYWWGWEVL